MRDISNKLELNILALQRSGHHAIINWILQNYPGRHCFLNNILPDTNPFLTHEITTNIAGFNVERELAGDHGQKDLLVFNYEDRLIPSVFSECFFEKKKSWVGNSLKTVRILILRDPFNNLASKCKWARGGTMHIPTEPELRWIVSVWKMHAREFLGETRLIPGEKIFISYNRWFTDALYRQELAGKLALAGADKGLSEVAKWGPNTWGDSFDNMTYDGRAQEMKVLERWKSFIQDDFFLSLVNDPELISLSERIFGHIPGTEAITKLSSGK